MQPAFLSLLFDQGLSGMCKTGEWRPWMPRQLSTLIDALHFVLNNGCYFQLLKTVFNQGHSSTSSAISPRALLCLTARSSAITVPADPPLSSTQRPTEASVNEWRPTCNTTASSLCRGLQTCSQGKEVIALQRWRGVHLAVHGGRD